MHIRNHDIVTIPSLVLENDNRPNSNTQAAEQQNIGSPLHVNRSSTLNKSSPIQTTTSPSSSRFSQTAARAENKIHPTQGDDIEVVVRPRKTASRLKNILTFVYTKEAASAFRESLLPHRQPPPPTPGHIINEHEISTGQISNQGAFLLMLDKAAQISSDLHVKATTTPSPSLHSLAATFSTIIDFLALFNNYISTYSGTGALERSEKEWRELSKLMIAISHITWNREPNISQLRTDSNLLLEKLERLIPKGFIEGFTRTHGAMIGDSYPRLMLGSAR